MFSKHCDSRVKSCNQKRFAKNTKIKLFINKYNWKEIGFRSGKVYFLDK